MRQLLTENKQGVASVPVIIGIITAVVFAGIVIAAFKQDKRRAPQPNRELEQLLQRTDEVDVSAGASVEEALPSEGGETGKQMENQQEGE